MITYPARPISGGRLELAPPKRGDWAVEPKFNGWRVLVHAPTGTAYNRHGKPLSISEEFCHACATLRCAWERDPRLEWIDCEGLERRHGLGKGALVVLDVVSEETYSARRSILEEAFDITPHNEPMFSLDVRLTPNFLLEDATRIYGELRELNDLWKVPYYEGVVMKQRNSPYHIQTRSSDETTPHWIKHRWR
jgi:ATP-dependent DNA ligase